VNYLGGAATILDRAAGAWTIENYGGTNVGIDAESNSVFEQLRLVSRCSFVGSSLGRWLGCLVGYLQR
jgi:hypothetical protein